jgi:hypothetical protein
VALLSHGRVPPCPSVRVDDQAERCACPLSPINVPALPLAVPRRKDDEPSRSATVLDRPKIHSSHCTFARFHPPVATPWRPPPVRPNCIAVGPRVRVLGPEPPPLLPWSPSSSSSMWPGYHGLPPCRAAAARALLLPRPRGPWLPPAAGRPNRPPPLRLSR